MRIMKEKTYKKIKKTLEFEETGEMLCITIDLENISPETKKETITPFLDTLYKRVLQEITL